MAVKIRLRRMGKKRQPSYRVVVADSRSPRDGRFIEQIGRYDPLEEPSVVEIDNDRALDWLGKGAQPTDAVRKLLEISGAWGRFRASKGEILTVGESAAPPPPSGEPPTKAQAAAAATTDDPAPAAVTAGEEAIAEDATVEVATTDDFVEVPADEVAAAADEPAGPEAEATEEEQS